MRTLLRTLVASGTVVTTLAVAAAPASAGACASADAAVGQASTTQLANAAVCLLNQERAKHGLRAFRVNRRLTTAATRHVRDMVARGYFSHDTRGGGSFFDRIRRTGYIARTASVSVGEDIAWGSGPLGSAHAILQGWMESPPHRANILDRSFREIGLGVAIGDPGAGQTGATYALDFGSGGRP
jgi:uncharacterized protein YkwD